MPSRPIAILVALSSLLAGCGPAPPPVWSEAEGLRNISTMACASPLSSERCIAAPVPRERGAPTLVIGDILGFAALATSGGDIFVATDRGEVLRVPTAGGPVDGFGGVRPGQLLDGVLLPQGRWFVVVAYGDPGGGRSLYRIGRRDSGWMATVQALPFLEGEELVGALEVTPGGTLVAVLGRRGKGHLDFGLVSVPEAGGARRVIMPFGSVESAALGVDATHAYFHGDVGLMRVPLQGGAPEPLGTSVTTALAVGDEEVFFAGVRGVEAVRKTTREVRLIEELHGSALGWAPVPRLWAVGGTAVWQARRLGPDGRETRPDELRRWTQSGGIEILATPDGDVEDAWIEGDLVLWIAPARHIAMLASAVFASRGPRVATVAAP